MPQQKCVERIGLQGCVSVTAGGNTMDDHQFNLDNCNNTGQNRSNMWANRSEMGVVGENLQTSLIMDSEHGGKISHIMEQHM